MTKRDSAHELVNALPEDQLTDLLDYLTDLRDTDETVSAETRAAIEEGLNDIQAGRTISLEDYRRTRGV